MLSRGMAAACRMGALTFGVVLTTLGAATAHAAFSRTSASGREVRTALRNEARFRAVEKSAVVQMLPFRTRPSPPKRETGADPVMRDIARRACGERVPVVCRRACAPTAAVDVVIHTRRRCNRRRAKIKMLNPSDPSDSQRRVERVSTAAQQ